MYRLDPVHDQPLRGSLIPCPSLNGVLCKAGVTGREAKWPTEERCADVAELGSKAFGGGIAELLKDHAPLVALIKSFVKLDGSVKVSLKDIVPNDKGNLLPWIMLVLGDVHIKQMQDKLHNDTLFLDFMTERDPSLLAMRQAWDRSEEEAATLWNASSAGLIQSSHSPQAGQSHDSTMSAADPLPVVRLQSGPRSSPMPSRSPSSRRATTTRIATISSHTPGGRTSSAHVGDTYPRAPSSSISRSVIASHRASHLGHLSRLCPKWSQYRQHLGIIFPPVGPVTSHKAHISSKMHWALIQLWLRSVASSALSAFTCAATAFLGRAPDDRRRGGGRGGADSAADC